MNNHVEHLKLLGLNALSWIGTIAGIQATKDFLEIACFLASLAVSGCSIWLIKRKADAVEASKEPQE